MISYSTKTVSDAWLVFQQEKNGDFAQAKIRVSPKKSHIIYK